MDKYDMMRMVLKVCESVSALACLFYYPMWKHTFWKWILFYLLFIAASEWGGVYLREHPLPFLANPEYYSFIVHPVSFFFLFWLFKQYREQSGKKDRLVPVFFLVYIAGCFTDYFFFRQKIYWFMSFSYMVGVVLLIILLVRFYYHYLFSDKILFFRNDIIFWISSVMFIYYVGTFPFFALRNTLFRNYYSTFEVYWFVQMGLSCGLYLSLILIYRWAKQK